MKLRVFIFLKFMSKPPSYIKASKFSDPKQLKDRILYRFFEMLPAVLSWATLIAAVVLSAIKPIWMAVFIIFFDFYWLVKSVYFSFFLRDSYRRLKKNQNTDWLKKVRDLDPEDYSLGLGDYKDLYHMVVFPAYNEDYQILKEGLDCFANSDYPLDNIIIVVGLEERRGEDVAELKKKLKRDYGDTFFDFLVTVHPDDIPGEIAGKSSNEAWAAKKAKEKIVDARGLDYERVIVSSLDADAQVPKGYFARLTYQYLTTENPVRTSYQPIPLYHNNVWESPAIARVIAFNTSFWQMIIQGNEGRQTNFSAYALSFEALEAVDFWAPDVIAEDSRIFYQCFLYYDGNYSIDPLFYPVSMDANVSVNLWKTGLAQYRQQRRWAWGIENVPYLYFGFYKNKSLALRNHLYKAFIALESHFSWATNALLIFLLGWAPIALGGHQFNTTVISYRFPILVRIFLTLAMAGLVTSAIIGVLITPKPRDGKKFKKVFLVLQWFLVPIALIFLGCFPALDAQTRLFLNKRLGYWTTEKVREEDSQD